MMGAPGTTPGPWWVRSFEEDGEISDCFVAAKDVNGFAFDAEILGDDEYRDGIKRKLADAHQIAASGVLYDAAEAAFDFLGGVDGASEIRAELLAAIMLAKGSGQ